MFASTILSIFILGIGGFWYQASSRVADLVLRQKADLRAQRRARAGHGSLRLYQFSCRSRQRPGDHNGYTDGLASIPTTRIIYPSSVANYAERNYVTTSYATFSGNEFYVLLKSNILPSLNRTYVWIDKSATSSAA
jgi:hypothetical protein